MTEHEMIGWHRRPDGREFDQTLRDTEGRGSPVSCSPRGHRVRYD